MKDKRNHAMKVFVEKRIRKTLLSYVLAFAMFVGCVSANGLVSYATGADSGTADASVDKARQDANEAEQKKNGTGVRVGKEQY